eukprot:3774579-Prymnesium_polylepis.1
MALTARAASALRKAGWRAQAISCWESSTACQGVVEEADSCDVAWGMADGRCCGRWPMLSPEA